MKKYSVVCFLDNSLSLKIKNIQQKLFEITGSRACFDSWEPHITLASGPELDSSNLKKLEHEIINFCSFQNTLEVSISDVGGKTNRVGGKGENTTPYALWFNILLNNSILELFTRIEGMIKQYPVWYAISNPYNPHITLAFRDLTKDGYEQGLNWLDTIKLDDEKIVIDHIALVEQIGETIKEYKRFYFKK